jgi:hypothetical protein
MPSQKSRSREQSEQEEVEVPCPNCGNKISQSEYRKLVKEAQEDDDGGIPFWVYIVGVVVLWIVVEIAQSGAF